MGSLDAEKDTKALTRDLILDRIDHVGGDAKLAQEMGLIPSTEQLKNLGFSDKELRELRLLDNPCN